MHRTKMCLSEKVQSFLMSFKISLSPSPIAGQLSQSAHFSLQLPYTVLGLGRSANFLDHLFVGIPRQPGETVRKYEILYIS